MMHEHATSAHLAYSSAQIAVTRCNNVALVLLHTLTEAVVCICARMGAGQVLNARVLQQSSRPQQAQWCDTAGSSMLIKGEQGCTKLLTNAKEPLVPHLCHLQCNPVFLAQLLQLRQHAGGKARRALSIQAVHHTLHKVNLRSKLLTSVPGWTCNWC